MILGVDLQKASMWKRISAWLFDSILLAVLVLLFALLLSSLLGYDRHSAALDEAYAKYEAQYGITFDIDEETYLSLPAQEKESYDAAYQALLADDDAIYAYNMVINLTLLIASAGILLAVMALEFVVPLCLKNGQTLGKKIFGIGLVRKDGVMVNTMQLFVRALLGKYTVEIMIPVYLLLMLLNNLMDVTGTVIMLALLLAQMICLCVTRTNSAIHDLLAGTVAVDISSQKIFTSTQDLIEYTKKIHAERAARQDY